MEAAERLRLRVVEKAGAAVGMKAGAAAVGMQGLAEVAETRKKVCD